MLLPLNEEVPDGDTADKNPDNINPHEDAPPDAGIKRVMAQWATNVTTTTETQNCQLPIYCIIGPTSP
jgi:hypothetical protein